MRQAGLRTTTQKHRDRVNADEGQGHWEISLVMTVAMSTVIDKFKDGQQTPWSWGSGSFLTASGRASPAAP